MFSFKNTFMRAAVLLAAVSFSLQSCVEDPIEPTPPVNNVPTQYSFTNVNYGGQTVRLLLIRDLVKKVEDAKTMPVLASELIAIYENTNAAYADISTNKKLSDKVANASVDAQLRAWFDSVQVMSAAGKGIILSNGTDLKHAIEKTLMGGVIYYRAVNDYLKKNAAADNNTVNAGEGTKMQHGWDEAFGYFGAARDYNNYTDALIINPGEKDADGNGTIDPKSEKNFYYGQTAAKRDVGSSTFDAASQTDYTKTLFDAFLKGRHAIDNKNYTARDEAIATVMENWEKIIAATIVHYINDTKADKTSGNSNLATHWSELKGYLSMLQFNPDKKISDAQMIELNNLTANSINEIDLAKLDQAAAIIKNAYGFTSQQISNW